MTRVEPDRWRAAVAEALAAGHTFLANLTAVDEVGRSDHIRVLLRLLNPDTGDDLTLETFTAREDARLADIAVLPYLNWNARSIDCTS